MATLTEATLTDAERRVLERLVPRLRDELGAEAVWLYGSRARGEHVDFAESDVDLLVIAPGEMRENSTQADRIYDQVVEEIGERPTWFSIHVWDRDWLDYRREIRSFFIQEVDRDKIVLHGEP